MYQPEEKRTDEEPAGDGCTELPPPHERPTTRVPACRVLITEDGDDPYSRIMREHLAPPE